MYLIFDVETVGLPDNFQAPVSDAQNWPLILEIAWLLINREEEVIQSESYVINVKDPVAEEVLSLTNITVAEIEAGWSITKVLSQFKLALSLADYIICHNTAFDGCVLAASFLRAGYDLSVFEAKKWYCTMKKSTPLLKLHSPYAPISYKWPKLSQLYYHFFGELFAGSHRALNDVWATWKCFQVLKNLDQA